MILLSHPGCPRHAHTPRPQIRFWPPVSMQRYRPREKRAGWLNHRILRMGSWWQLRMGAYEWWELRWQPKAGHKLAKVPITHAADND